ncbi:MAG: glycosyltransferase N-terminal domain-containing protein [Gemmatimonadota bacterium]
MNDVPLLYRLAMGLAHRAAPLVARPGSKLTLGVAGRRDAHETLAAWGERSRDANRPTAWFHAPSVGEALQAGAVIEALRERRPGLQIALTHFSPSAEGIAERVGADMGAYLPWDEADLMRRALDGLRPDLLVFAKTEVWPVLVSEAVARGIPVALVGAVVPRGAGRMRRAARALLASTWRRLSLACAVGEEDARALVLLGVPERAVNVTGDPAIDAATRRAGEADPAAPWLAPFHEDPRPTLVAGSTWPEDEAVLLPALAEVRRVVPDLRVVFVPHEPTADVVGGLLTRLQGLGWKCRPLSAVESRGTPGDAAVVVVDRVGVLADLYTVATVAYIGGGFGRGGLHSVLEPAAAGAPVVFGPRHQRAPAAAGLLAAGAARTVSDAAALAAILAEWLTDPAKKIDVAHRGIDYIESHRGAAARTADLLVALPQPSHPE